MNSSSPKRTYVLYHASCTDGFGSAWAAWLRLGDGAEYIPVQYGEGPPALVHGSDLYIVDFSYPRDYLLAADKVMNKVVVLDHHATAREELEGLELAGEESFVRFEEGKSGAVMAWEHFHPGTKPELLCRYVEDRDLWKWELARSREVNAAIRSHPMDFREWSRLSRKVWAFWSEANVDILREGQAILRAQKQVVDMTASKAALTNFDGYVVPVVNATAHISEVCQKMLEDYPDAPFAASFFVSAEDGTRTYSLRSRPDDFDVGAFAREYGGGGHRQAAGYRIGGSQ